MGGRRVSKLSGVNQDAIGLNTSQPSCPLLRSNGNWILEKCVPPLALCTDRPHGVTRDMPSRVASDVYWSMTSEGRGREKFQDGLKAAFIREIAGSSI